MWYACLFQRHIWILFDIWAFERQAFHTLADDFFFTFSFCVSEIVVNLKGIYPWHIAPTKCTTNTQSVFCFSLNCSKWSDNFIFGNIFFRCVAKFFSMNGKFVLEHVECWRYRSIGNCSNIMFDDTPFTYNPFYCYAFEKFIWI